MEALDESVKQMIGHNITGVVQSVEGEAGRLRVVADFGKASGVLEKWICLNPIISKKDNLSRPS